MSNNGSFINHTEGPNIQVYTPIKQHTSSMISLIHPLSINDPSSNTKRFSTQAHDIDMQDLNEFTEEESSDAKRALQLPGRRAQTPLSSFVRSTSAINTPKFDFNSTLKKNNKFGDALSQLDNLNEKSLDKEEPTKVPLNDKV